MDKIEAKLYVRIIILFICCTSGLQINAQETIKGIVMDSLSKKPISNVMVYFDRTSIGTITNQKGYFEITKPEGITTPLIISYLGYDKVSIEEPKTNELLKISLTEKTNWLKSVVITSETDKKDATKLIKASGEQRDIWFDIFEKHFLGMGDATRRTEIENEDALIFKYNPKTEVVYVTAKEPLIIENRHLKYQITYTLDTFWFELLWNDKFNRWVAGTYYIAGTSFFTDMLDPAEDSDRKIDRIHERRKEAYLGSSLHFMRALVNSELAQQGFEVYRLSKFDQMLYASFLRIPDGKFTKIVPPNNFVIEYNKEESEVYAMQESFLVDKFGNFHPWFALKFRGYIGGLGMSSAVPLNYGIQENMDI